MKWFRIITLTLALLMGAMWFFASARYAVQAGWDSDVMRQWVVSQYLNAQENPWRIAAETLKLNYGPAYGENRFRLKDLVIYEVHPQLPTDGIDGVLPDYGPPTATYPPSSLFPIWMVVGGLPERVVLPFWLVVNSLALAFIAWLWWARCLRQPRLAFAGQDGVFACGLALAVLLLWPPTQEVVRTSQFVFVVIPFLLLALQYVEYRGWWSGVYFSLALIKPSLVLPFLFIPLIRLQWRVFVVIALTHGAAWLAVSWWLSASPLALLIDWLTIPRYMLQGAYTLQEYVNRMGLDNTTLGTLLTLGFVAGCALLALRYRSASNDAMVPLFVACSLLWTYHERYDFVLVLLAAPLLLSSRSAWPAKAGLVVFLALGMALTDWAYMQDAPLLRVLRWGGRLAMLAFLGLAIMHLRNAAKSRTWNRDGIELR